jgi:SAM-dependent methyltransferase
MHTFTCNVCDSACRAEVLERETPSCARCGSNVRFRWIVQALSVALFGEGLPLTKFRTRKEIRGLGLSDPIPIAAVLAKKFDYRNTFFNREPRFDIMADVATAGQYDFIVASEVFEHVVPPVQTAFDNLARLLKPGGVAIFSSPWEPDGETVEHFPLLHDWQLVKLQSGYVLVNRTADRRLETFEDLNFHDGPGSTLEMRVFSRAGLLANCAAAGFEGISMAEDNAAFGIVWEPWARGFVLRKSHRA